MINKYSFSIFLYATIFLLSTPIFSQDTLVLRSGRRVPFTKINEYSDLIQVKDYQQNKLIDFLPESIIGYSQALKDETYFLIFEPEGQNRGEYLFVERLEVGVITLYAKERGGFTLYAEKNNSLFEIYNIQSNKTIKGDNLSQFKSIISDDQESEEYVSSSGFKFKTKEIQKVIQYYNRRNYQDHQPSSEDVLSTIYFYRTKFQKTKEKIRIKLNGQLHELYIEDFIQLDLPINHASKLTFFDSHVRNDIILSGGLKDQFYEVLYDPRDNVFQLDPKDGTELHFEFNGIKEKVINQIGKD
ncbi:MAG: hypothetical protein OCD76_08755 [Reichenbachiella sp.]